MDVISDPMKLCIYDQTLSRSCHGHAVIVSYERLLIVERTEVQFYCSYIEILAIILLHHQSHHKPHRVGNLENAGGLTLSNYSSKTIRNNPDGRAVVTNLIHQLEPGSIGILLGNITSIGIDYYRVLMRNAAAGARQNCCCQQPTQSSIQLLHI